MAIKRPVPRDVSTVVSILPFACTERKPGLRPSEFRFPAVADGDIFLLLVERCSHAVYLDEARPTLVVPDPSDQVAEAIVNDLKQSIHGFVQDVAEPGVSWVYGEFPNTPEGKSLFVAQHRALLIEMREKQLEWFTTIVRMADDDWGRYRRHSFITPTQRQAAIVLGLKKEWLLEQEIEEALSKCKFCFQMVHPDAIICAHCHGILDQQRYAREFKEAALGQAPPRPLVVGQNAGQGGGSPTDQTKTQ